MPDSINGIHFADNNSMLVFYKTGYTVLDNRFGTIFKENLKKGKMYDATISSDGAKAAYTTFDNDIHVVDIMTGRKTKIHIESKYKRESLSWSQKLDGPVLYGLRYDKIYAMSPKNNYIPEEINVTDKAFEEAFYIEGGHLVITPNGFYFLDDDKIRYHRVLPSLITYVEGEVNRLELSTSSDGRTVFLPTDNGQGVIVDLERRLVSTGPNPNLSNKPDTSHATASLKVEMKKTRSPIINGKRVRIPFNSYVTSYSHLPNGDTVVGTHMMIICYTPEAKLRWIDFTLSQVLSIVPIDNGNKIVTVYPDGCIRFNNAKTGSLILSCFIHPDKKRWIMWTPEGFFDHSPGGESLVGFHVNQGAGKQAKFYSIDRFYDTFYRPDLVQYRLMGTYENLIAQAKKESGSIINLIDKGAPPKIAIACTIEDGIIQARVTATDKGGGIGPISYYINGTKVAEDGSPSSAARIGAQYALERAFVASPGRNTVEVRSFSIESGIESVTATATLKNNVYVQKRNLYILAVGVDAYLAKELTLQNAVNDARYLSSALRKGAHESFTNVFVENVENRKATRSSIINAIESIGKKAKPEDCFVLYLSGHGLTLNSKYHFLPSELETVSEQSILQQALNQELLNQALLSVPARESLIILDTCQSGAFVGKDFEFAMKAATGRLNRATGRAVLTAASSQGNALEGYKGHGLFTYVLVDGLKGKADNIASDKQVSLVEVGEYVTKGVPALSSKVWGMEQQPTFYHRGNDFVLTNAE